MSHYLKLELPLSILSLTRHDINNGMTEGLREFASLERGFRVFLGNEARLAGARACIEQLYGKNLVPNVIPLMENQHGFRHRQSVRLDHQDSV